MGPPIDTHNTIVRLADVARIKNVQQQRDETQRRQFALALQQEAVRKETQVQTSHRTESPEIQKEAKRKEEKKKRRRSRKRKEDSDDEEQHIDVRID